MTPQPRLDAVGVHNRVLRAASRRIDELETQLADALLPILERAGAQAAAGFQRTVTNHLTAAAVDGVTSLSTMLAVKPRPEEAAALALADGTPPETLHVTLAYLGEVEGDLGAVAEALRPVAASHAPLEGVVGGAGFFAPNPEGVGPAILLPDVPGLVELRVAATEALTAAGIDYARLHGFTAHLTVAYFDEDGNVVGEGGDGGSVDDPRPLFGSPLHFDALLVVRGDVVEAEIPLVGRPPMTAAADPVPGAARQVERAEAALREALAGGDPEQVRQAKRDLKDARGLLYDAVRGPQWSSPAPDEVIDADALARAFRTKTDPVRQALLQATMTPALKAAGLEFDLANPLAAKVLAQSGSQVVEIARTTQLNVMRIIRASHDQGLSIPDTAKAIQAGMKDAAPARALLIARTELAGAVNGGSLAATRIVSDATGETYVKRWMTAPGAPNPRHELYEGLDGQTVGLEEPFDVGGDALMFPGDPDGSPEEVCNCRCTVVYDTPEGEQESSDGEAPDLAGDPSALGFGSGASDAAAAPDALAPSEVLSIQGGTRGALVEHRQAIESSIASLGQLVQLPGRAASLPADGVKVTMRRNEMSRGHFKTLVRAGQVEKVEINVGSPAHPAVTMAHEFGHFLDQAYMGENPLALATRNVAAHGEGELRDALFELVAAWHDSDAYKTLEARGADSLARYMRSNAELWARSFSQWAAEHSPADSALAREMARDVAKEAETVAQLGSVPGWRFYPETWQPGDFDRIGPAVERVLRAARLRSG